ncbi:hypothetical protein [Azohydromonas lata]|uniref:Hpr(Ser) kinase/phosphatase n=1 Tax=Azohydromonas lata TaxID=45677 RepID=A0ABU5IRA3_9BURK|nr:hypothetical protein [Azohydromonas lata]MDZ5461426.1 hypothetical protein [Azohydromonas lata]
MPAEPAQPALPANGADPGQPAWGPDDAAAWAFQVLGQTVRIACDDAAPARVLRANFAALPAADAQAEADLDYRACRHPQGDGWMLLRRGHPAVTAPDLCDLLYHLEKDLIIALQLRRPTLLHLHAAALEFQGRAWLLAGDSGAGKSTTAWGLLHHGFNYLSDELSPVDLEALAVHAYPHALCLKRRPPNAPAWPEGQVLELGRTMHIPVAALPAAVVPSPCPLGGMLFIRHDPLLREPELRPLHAAEAGAHLYVTTLNALAHARHGMDAVVGLAKSVPAWSLTTADLDGTCRLVRKLALQQSRQAGD